MGAHAMATLATKVKRLITNVILFCEMSCPVLILIALGAQSYKFTCR